MAVQISADKKLCIRSIAALLSAFAAIIVNFETKSAPNAAALPADTPVVTNTFGTCNQPIYEAFTGDKVVLKIPEPGDITGSTGQRLPSTTKFEIDTITSTGLTTKHTGQ